MDGMTAVPEFDRLFKRAAEFVDSGRFGAARPLLAALERVAPPSARLAQLKALLALREGRPIEACESLDQAILTWPADATSHKCRADARRQLGDFAGAARDAAEAVTLDPGDPDAKAILGVALLGLGHAEDARVCLKEAVVARPTNPLFALALSDAQAASGDDDAATATLRDATLRMPDELALRNAALLLAVRSRRFDVAVELAEAARREGVVDACVFGLKGHALSSLGRHSEAAEAYAEARKLGPKDPYVRHLAAASGALPEADRAPEDYVRTVFDGYAARFEAHLISLGYRVPGLLRAALLRHAEIGADQKLGPVLDLGCGTGLMAVALIDLPVGPITGVDLSPRMLAAANAKHLYAELREDDILRALDQDGSAWRIVLAADLLCYFGALEQLMASVRRRLAPGGLLLFSVETSEETEATPRGWRLERLGRYTHASAYLRHCAAAADLELRELAQESLRREAGVLVPGLVAVLAAP